MSQQSLILGSCFNYFHRGITPASRQMLFIYTHLTHSGIVCSVSISTATATLGTLDGVTCINVCRKLPYTKLIP